MRLLVLDFDGVISDSAQEAFGVAVRAYAEVRGPTPSTLRDDDASLYRRFLELMPLGNRAEDYFVALLALEEDVPLESQADYDAFHSGQDEALLQTFHQRFYEIRGAWAARDPEGWRSRMRPYPGLCELLRRRHREARLAIATSKDRRSVRALLRAYAIDDLFPEQCVLDKETGVRKRSHIERLARDHGLAWREITFVDDKVNHLHDVASLGVRCVLAAWGYNGPREWMEAERAGFLVCRLEDVETRVFGSSGRP